MALWVMCKKCDKLVLEPHRCEKKKPLLSLFLGKHVTVEVERGLEIKGKLLRYQLGKNEGSHNHKPNLLILQNGSNRHIIRGSWVAIKMETSWKRGCSSDVL